MRNNETSAVQSLRSLYRDYGYSRFKMNKFEEYDTYAKIKDYLISDKVITFTDMNGKLLAMKPDVTVSIIKNSDDEKAGVEKLYYNENVYRISNGTHDFREIVQTGLECIGDIDLYNICEVILLAVESLKTISEDFVLDISHMGFVSGLISAAGFDESEAQSVISAVSEKNLPKLSEICDKKGLCGALAEKIKGLVTFYGPVSQIAEKLDSMIVNAETAEAAEEIKTICKALIENDMAENVELDFSVVNDMKYYNGIVFGGYIEGIPTDVLSGGQYDKLMKKMGKNKKAIGFAVYLDLLEQLKKQNSSYDVDVALCYDETVGAGEVLKKAQEIIKSGKTVHVQRCAPEKIRYKEKITLKEGGAKIENS